MPELPEVETIKLGLEKKIVGLTIKSVQVLNKKTFQGSEKDIIGKKVVRVWRRAKILGIDLALVKTGPVTSVSQVRPRSLTSDAAVDARDLSSVTPVLTIIFHLKMTGQLIYDPSIALRVSGKRLIGGHPTFDMRNEMPTKHTRVIFKFNNGSTLYFNDLRKFGWVKVISSQSSDVRQLLEKFGPEPLEKNFTWQILKTNLLRHKSLPVKVVIMDQAVVSGVGNIYASESLFEAKIDPRRKVSTLSDSDFKNLVEGIKLSLTTALKYGGSTIANFVDSDGKKGYFIDYAKVYGKARQKCSRCSGKIMKIQQAGRGTYFCEHCQK